MRCPKTGQRLKTDLDSLDLCLDQYVGIRLTQPKGL
jgi:hypothetical protein